MKEQSQATHYPTHWWSALTALLLVIALVALTACQPIQPPAASTEADAATIPEVTIAVNEQVMAYLPLV
ncbi:MAG: hypothetical protein DYG89_42200 [Caldilinea sp. CFX5]|nr:hypothetical protein [Caldilinea sp. CFX5]